jgi:hypothetical protein
MSEISFSFTAGKTCDSLMRKMLKYLTSMSNYYVVVAYVLTIAAPTALM